MPTGTLYPQRTNRSKGLVLLAVVGAGLLLACPLVAAENVAGGPVAAWNFDDAMNQSIPDLSGNANDVNVRGGTLVKGVNNRGLESDGRSTSASCVPTMGLNPSRTLSLEAWVKPYALADGQFPTVLRKDGAYALRFGNNHLAFLLWTGGKVVYLYSKKTYWVPDHWYHVAATYDGTEMRLFVDGKLDKILPQTGTIDSSPAVCGIGSSGRQQLFHGVIDEVRIFDRALSTDEIARTHSDGLRMLREQEKVRVAALPLKPVLPELRKPPREITMLQDGFLWIDAEDFSDYGGWLLDTQFVHLMGSGYLIAASVGTPVKDAAVDVTISKAGKYRVWVRAKNWLQEYSPGQFQVIVGGVPSKQVFGTAPTEEWLWQSAGEYELAQGRTSIALRDLTGYYGRCDALILTTDLDYTPPVAVDAIQKERSRLAGGSLDPKQGGQFDVIVVGGGAAGSCTALAAARMGARTALIQDRPVLGGNASSELGVPINGAASLHPNARESGIIEEAGRIKARYHFPKMSEAFERLAQEEKHLTVFFNERVIGAEMENEQRIGSVRAVNTLTNEITEYHAKVFLDCTGDGWLGYYAGAKYRQGRESREEFNESLAPEKADKITMSGCLMGKLALSYRAENRGQPVEYTAPPWAAKLPPPEEFGRHIRHLGGEWWLERPGTVDGITDAEKSRDELIRISYGYWDFIKNAWPDRQRAANYALTFVPITEAKRETRRLIGDYILTQNDTQSGAMFPDRVSYAGWPLDVHHAEGIFSGKVGPFHCNAHVPINSIPFRCLYSVNVDNLLFAGRNLSVTHIALGTVRVQGTLAAIGQAAGTAAALCVKHNVTPRDLGKSRLHELQQVLLKNDQYIPGLVNEDPNDLARTATVTASSTASYDLFGRQNVEPDEEHPLGMNRAVMFPRGRNERIGSLWLLLGSEKVEPTEITLHLREAATAGDFSSTEDVATATAQVPARKRAWVEFKLDREVQSPYVWAWLPRTDGVSWRLMSSAPRPSCRAYGGKGSWTVVEGQYYAFCTDPPLAIPTDYLPENVINGVTRIVGTTSNMWASDPSQSLPQWVELRFPKPVKLNTVYLTFDTDMNAPFHTVPLPFQCVRDYELSYYDGSTWIPLATVKGNFQRRRVHRFDTVAATQLRLTAQATNGDRSARVFEIRAYQE